MLNKHDFEPDNKGFILLLLVTNRWLGYGFNLYLKDRIASLIIKALIYLINYLKYQHNVNIKVIECDNKFTDIKPEVIQTLSNYNICVELSIPYMQSQNRAVE